MYLRKVYKALLRLYPEDYRRQFAAEMLFTFDQLINELSQDATTQIRFAVIESFGLIRGIFVEWIGKAAYTIYRSANLVRSSSLAADIVSEMTYRTFRENGSFFSRCIPDLRMMRPLGVSRESWYGSSLRSR